MDGRDDRDPPPPLTVVTPLNHAKKPKAPVAYHSWRQSGAREHTEYDAGAAVKRGVWRDIFPLL